VAGVTAATLGIMSIARDSALFVVSLAPRAADGALFASAQERVFLVFAILLGIGMGPMQAASRTLVARLAPPGMAGEFFGLFALSGRATAFLAPLLVAVATDVFASQRAGLAVVLVFLAAGFVLMLRVREEQARPLA
jgi:MFS transporter, UMF1 family